MVSLRKQLDGLQEQAQQLQRQMLEEIEAVHRSYRRELVRWEPPGEVLLAREAKPFKIPVERRDGH
jgi:hypothetical protein